MTAPDAPRGRRRRALVVGGGVAALVLASVGAAVLLGRPADAGDAAAAPPATAPVTRATLAETEDLDGTLGYGEPTAVTGQLGGTLTWRAPDGAVVEPGAPLYRVDETPVVLLAGTTPAYRDLRAGDEGADVRQLEEGLRALGYSGFTVDDAYTASTATAVSGWQRDAGLPRTGVVERGRVVFLPGAVRVAGAAVDVGAALAPGQPVLETTGTGREVAVDLDVQRRGSVAEGQAVTVVLPDGTEVPGTVAAVGSVAREAEGSDASPAGAGTSGGATVRVTVAVGTAEVAAYDQAPVTVRVVSAERPEVLTVPVAALLAVPGGGYAVEVVTGSGTEVVPVTTGLFADGRVEVSGDGIAEGTRVGVPSR